MNLWAYIFKRVLLMIPTLLGVLTLTFIVVQFVPGGPVEQMVSQLRGKDGGAAGEAATAQGIYRGAQGIAPQQLAELRTLYGFDKPPLQREARNRDALWKLSVGNQHDRAVGGQSTEHLDEQPVGELAVDAGSRFVENHHGKICEQRPCERDPELTVLVPRTRAAELSQYLTHLSRYRGRNDMLHALDRDHPVLYPGKLLHKLLHRHTSRFLNMP